MSQSSATSTDLRRVDGERPGLGRGLATQARIFHALILRELSSRFGRENIGYLWVFGEPMLLASVITVIHLAEPNHSYGDASPAAFAILGYTIFIIFRGVISRAEGIVDHNKEVFFHSRISIFDLLLARTVIETLACTLVTIILMGIAITFDLARLPERPLYLLGASGLMAWWSFAVSLIVARITYKNETMGRQVHVFAYFCIPLSGAFWQLSMTPAWIQSWLQYFPMTLIFEQARYGQFEYSPARYVHPLYVCAVNAVLTYLGLILVRRLRYQL